MTEEEMRERCPILALITDALDGNFWPTASVSPSEVSNDRDTIYIDRLISDIGGMEAKLAERLAIKDAK